MTMAMTKSVTAIILAGALGLSLAGCDTQEGEPVARAQIGDGPADPANPNAGPGLDTALKDQAREGNGAESVCRKVEFEGTALTHCTADPARHSITTALADNAGSNYRSLDQLAETLDNRAVAFAVNAGMFDGEGDPIGYYVESGERLEELDRDSGNGNFYLKPNGVFYGSAGNWRIRTTDSFLRNVSDRPQFGTQSGPMLLIEGELHPEFQDDGPSKAVRNAVGLDASGKAHFVMSEGELSFGKLARYYRDEIKAQNALFLDGKISALWDPATGRMDNGAALGPMVVVMNKAESN
jgi:uncharacterized protein YigE (DUF2233 family)